MSNFMQIGTYLRLKYEKLRAEKVEEYRNRFYNPYVAAKLGYVDMVVDFPDTRDVLITLLEASLTKRERNISKKHGNMPA